MNNQEKKNINTDKSVAIVTGSSAGIGLQTSLLLARNGFDTYAGVRNLEKSKFLEDIARDESLSLQLLQLDVNSDESVSNSIGKVIAERNNVDVLVNNAGYGLLGALEELSMNNIKAQFETNFFGAIRCIKEIIPVMRQRRSGIIVNISSQAGYIGFPLCSFYDSTKFALEGLIEAMTYEVEPYGIKMVLIEPGCINSDFLNRLVISNNTQGSKSPYFDMFKKFTANYFEAMNNAPPPETVAKVILEAITSTNPLLRYQIGDDADTFFKAKKEMTDENIRKLMIETVLK
jgi:NAD(P)-dependent dehydrogenase (short-subunit alcohol dehydrogenase family)